MIWWIIAAAIVLSALFLMTCFLIVAFAFATQHDDWNEDLVSPDDWLEKK